MEKDLGKIKKNDFTDIVVRLDDFGGRPGVTIREFVTGDRYTGFTKSGVKIQAADLSKFKEMINSIKDSDLEVPASEKIETESSKKLPNEQKTLSGKDKGKKKEESEDDSVEEDEETEFDDY